jgi:DNA-binding NtrC family response regulator
VIERAMILSAGEPITMEHLPIERLARSIASPSAPVQDRPPKAAGRLARRGSVRAADEREKIVRALKRCGGNQTDAAKLLGMSRGTLISRLVEYGIPRPRRDDP